MWRRNRDWHDAAFAIEQFGEWVRNSDTKATILGGAIGLVATVGLSALPALTAIVCAGGWRSWLAAVMSAGTLAALVATGVAVYQSLRPRTVVGEPTRFGWPVVASSGFSIASLRPEDARAEAWEQARVLANIASEKFRWFGLALKFTAVAIPMGFVTFLVTLLP